MEAAFFEPAGDGAFLATPATAGPWSPDAQHGGPPSALAAWVIEQHEPSETQRLARVAVDILRPVPVGKLTTRARECGPGAASPWWNRSSRQVGRRSCTPAAGGSSAPAGPCRSSPAGRPRRAARPAHPRRHGPRHSPPAGGADGRGYLSHIDWQFLGDGAFAEPGPGRAWARPRIALIAGQESTPMCRALLVADSGSGMSAVLDGAGFIFINVDLTVALTRDPAGDWLLLDATTRTGADGTGLARTVLSDTAGVCGTGLQTLLVAPV